MLIESGMVCANLLQDHFLASAYIGSMMRPPQVPKAAHVQKNLFCKRKRLVFHTGRTVKTSINWIQQTPSNETLSMNSCWCLLKRVLKNYFLKSSCIFRVSTYLHWASEAELKSPRFPPLFAPRFPRGTRMFRKDVGEPLQARGFGGWWLWARSPKKGWYFFGDPIVVFFFFQCFSVEVFRFCMF